MRIERATFGAGSFWQAEQVFRQLPGIVNTVVGFMGGRLPEPAYEEVCTDLTGHVEVVQIDFDADRLGYERLLEVFWSSHDPTSRDCQGPYAGSQYRSAIFVHDPGQEAQARASRQRLEARGRYPRPIVTEITAAGPFYRAEQYHQRYLEKHRMPAPLAEMAG